MTILKPNSSRPANSERYFVCYNLKEEQVVNDIKEYLWVIAKRLWELRDNSERDVLEIVPLEVIQADERFYSYIVHSNNRLIQGDSEISMLLQKKQYLLINLWSKASWFRLIKN